MTKKQKNNLCRVIRKKKACAIEGRLLDYKSGDTCVLGALLLDAGVSKQQIMDCGGNTPEYFKPEWIIRLNEKFGVEGIMDDLIAINDENVQTCGRKRALMAFVMKQ